MAIIWQKSIGERKYQVRQAGASVRLYTNGVFHSQFNPKYPLNGNIWDLLTLPALFAPEKIQHALILGLGGGAVVKALQTLTPKIKITAIELDSTHIFIAKEYFGLKPSNKLKLVQADAIQWLKNYRGEKFDFILDDLFIEADGDPNRAVDSDAAWCKHLVRNLSAHGVLAVNFDSQGIFRRSALVNHPTIANRFKSKLALSISGYENRIGAFFKTAQTKDNLFRNIATIESVLGRSISQRLKVNIRRISE